MNILFKRVVSVLMLLLFVYHGMAQSTRTFKSFKQADNLVSIQVSDGVYQFEVLSDKIIHTTFRPSEKQTKDYAFGAILASGNADYKVNEGSDAIQIISSGIEVLIQKAPFHISYTYKGKDLLAEKQGYAMDDSLQYMSLAITEDEVLYGAGARVLGMDRRGYKLNLYNRAHYGYETHSELMNYTMPMFISSNQYAVFFDNASVGHLDLDSEKTNTITYETVSGTVNYYVIAGDDWFDLTEQNTNLTGKQPLPPRWAFGGFSSRFGYHSQEETEATVDKFLEDSIPLDAIIIDIFWFGKDVQGHMGNLDWYLDSFPEPVKMMKDFEEKGVKTILVTEPFILTTCDRWDEAVEKEVLGTDTAGNAFTYDFYFGNTGLVDVFKPEGKAWFWDIYSELTKQGVGGWWGDLGEPEVHPAALQHANGFADEVHNAYGHEWARMVYEGYQKDFPDTRPFILMRSGYVGSQRYGMIPWTGDVSRSWGGLTPQTEISLQMGMQGMAYMHSDLGGFAGDENVDEELYVRWLQYGVFQPIYRPHAQEAVSIEIANQVGETKELAKQALNLRYKLLPYIYNMAYENSLSGKPLMIPLFYVEPESKELLTYDKAYMWGDAFLVAPVKEAGLKKQKIYLPKENVWTDFYTEQVYQGGQSIELEVQKEYIPTLVKSGSFVPMQKKVVSASEYVLNNFETHYYHSENISSSSYSLYNDDGESTRNIASETYRFNAKYESKRLSVTVDKKGSITDNSGYAMDLIIHHVSALPKQVLVDGKKLKPSKLSYENGKLLIPLVSGNPKSEVILIWK